MNSWLRLEKQLKQQKALLSGKSVFKWFESK